MTLLRDDNSLHGIRGRTCPTASAVSLGLLVDGVIDPLLRTARRLACGVQERVVVRLVQAGLAVDGDERRARVRLGAPELETSAGSESKPSPAEEIDEVTSSVPTVREVGSS
jgi:hypothetical protein